MWVEGAGDAASSPTSNTSSNALMKLGKAFLAGLALFATSSAINAQTVVRLTGSTAYRGATHTAIQNVLQSGYTYAYTGTSLSGAGQAIFTGNLQGTGDAVIIKTSWSGSAGGVQTVSNGINVNFLANGVTQSTGGTASTPSGSSAELPDVAMSDTYQGATPFTTTTLTDTVVGVVPFKWVASRGLAQVSISVDTVSGSNVYTTASTGSLAVGMTVVGANIPAASKIGSIVSGTQFTLVDSNAGVTANKNAAATTTGNACTASTPCPIDNISPQLAQVLYGNGSCELALFTGSASDIGTKVWAIGRDPDSGTRLTAFAEAGIGVSATVTQYQPTTTGTGATLAVSSQAPWPLSVVNGITFSVGNGGYASGGTLAGVMGATTSAIGGYYVTYLSTGDAAVAINAGAKELLYNGVQFSNTALQQGKYTFWGYEHLMYKATLAGVAKTAADKIANRLISNDATILLGSMKVVRSSDGGLVSQNY